MIPHPLFAQIYSRAKNCKRVDILYRVQKTCKFLDLRMLAEQLDGLSYNRLVELALGVDRKAPKAKPAHSYTRNRKISEVLKGPADDLQHLINYNQSQHN